MYSRFAGGDDDVSSSSCTSSGFPFSVIESSKAHEEELCLRLCFGAALTARSREISGSEVFLFMFWLISTSKASEPTSKEALRFMRKLWMEQSA